MALAGIELSFLVKNLSELTEGYYVSNIYGINRENLLFKLHHPQKSDVFLMLSTSGIWATSNKIEQIEQNKLLRRLRSELLRAKNLKIEQLGTERIAYIRFSNFDKELTLVAEFFGDGNLLLCNNEMKILALLHSMEVRHRKLSVGLQYATPPQDNFDIFKKEFSEFKQEFATSTPVAKIVGKLLGLPRRYTEEIIKQAKIDTKTPSENISDEQIQNIFDLGKQLLTRVIDGDHEAIIVKGEKNSDVYPIKLSVEDDEKIIEVSSFMDGLDKLFTEQIIEKGKTTQSNVEDKKVTELETKLDEQSKAIRTVKQKSEEIAKVANALLTIVSLGVSHFDDSKITDILDQNNSKIIKEKGITYLKISDSKIKINTSAPIQTIASVIFDGSKKQKGAIASIERLIKRTEKDLEKAIHKSQVSKGSIGFQQVRKKTWFERYRWFFTSDGILAIGGRDSSSNSAVIRKHVEKNDKIFHAEINGSPFFILKDEQNAATPLSLKEVAHATACFSRAWKEEIYGINAYWVNPDQVKKAAPTGQTMGKGSFMIEGQRNFFKVTSLKLAIGILQKDEVYLLTCGPPEIIKKSCVCYVIIEPAGTEMADVAKKIKNKFSSINEEMGKLFNIDDFVRVLPSGSSKITEAG